MTVKGGTTPACAVCKYQRRRCSPNCGLAPYFPANEPKMFQNVHRLFRVSNITKILDSLDTTVQKDDAMKSIIFEAEMRHRFPVHGCSVILSQLRFQMETAIEELTRLYSKIREQKQLLLSSNNINTNEVNYHQQLHQHDMSNHCTLISPMQMIQAQITTAFGIDHQVYFPEFEGIHDSHPHPHPPLFQSSPESSSSSIKETKAAQNNICEGELKTAAAGLTLTMDPTSNS